VKTMGEPESRRPLRALGLGVLVCLASLAGCMVGPNFQRPEAQVPAKWVGPVPPPAAETPPAEVDLATWWTVFQDPTLESLVQRAVQSNLDLKVAESRIRQARAARAIAASGLGPTLDLSAAAQRRRAAGVTANQYQTGFDAGWEVDLFGGVRRGTEAADADLQASVEARRDVLVTLAAEVAREYVDLRTSQQRIDIAQQNLKAQQHTADLTRQRFEGGFASGLDVANADSQVATTASQIPLLEAAARQSVYNLSVLLGREPGALVEELSPASPVPPAPPSVPVGVPSDLLRRRPDIRAAEANIHADTARIGVATADLFPKFTLNGSIGFSASDLGSWFNPAGRSWSVGPAVSWNLFNTGRTQSNIELQEAFQEESFIAYRQTVLAALQEVENALIASAKEEEHRKELVSAVAANRKAVDLSIKLYTEGLTDFLNVLNAQRSLYGSEDALAQSTSTVSTDLVALYKALGGGWEESVDAGGGAAKPE